MKEFSQVSNSAKPQKKIAELVGERIEIQNITEKTIDFKGQPTTFYTLILTDGTTVGANATLAKQVKENEKDLPFAGTVTSHRSKRGVYYVLE